MSAAFSWSGKSQENKRAQRCSQTDFPKKRLTSILLILTFIYTISIDMPTLMHSL